MTQILVAISAGGGGTLIADLLRDDGYDVVHTPGEDVLDELFDLEEEGTLFDVVVTDVLLGPESIDELDGVGVVILDLEDEDTQDAEAMGARVLHRPIDVSDVLAAVEDLLDDAAERLAA